MRPAMMMILAMGVGTQADTVIGWLGWPHWTGLPVAIVGAVAVGALFGLVWPRRRVSRTPPPDTPDYALRLWQHWGQS